MQSHIAIFDSGVGGTSVMSHIQAHLPHLNISYLMDNLYLPYGAQPLAKVQERLLAAVQFFESLDDVKLIVIACNTASTQVLDWLRARTSIAIVGVVPAIKPAAQLTKTGHIALLATPATINQNYVAQLERDFAASVTCHRYGCVDLVAIAEQKLNTQEEQLTQVRGAIERLAIDPKCDVLVLGCTHFPLIAEEINKVVGEQVTLLDSGAAIAKRVASLLEGESAKTAEQKNGAVRFYATAPLRQTNWCYQQVTL